MVQPIDLQVLLNRTLELQRTQAVTLRQPQEENEIFKNRTNQEIAEEERQVREKEKVHGRVEEEKTGSGGDAWMRERTPENRSLCRRQEGRAEKEKGRLIDMEV